MPKNELDLHLQRLAKGGYSTAGDVFTITGSLDENRIRELLETAQLDGFKVVLESGVLKLRRR